MPGSILLMHGPNLNLLGERNPAVYGTTSLRDIEEDVREVCAARGYGLATFQSNHEGALIDTLHDARRSMAGAILNAGAFTHTSVALRDAIEGTQLAVVEVHISNTHAREPFRHVSLIAGVCIGSVTGLGRQGYGVAAGLLMDYLERRAND